MGPAELDDETRRRIEDELRAGRKISAIKIYREATGKGLAEAKEAVEAMPRGEVVSTPTPSDPDSLHEVAEHLRAGRKIEAIKVYRERTGVGLREAKRAVEAMTVEPGAPTVRSPSGCLTASVLLVATCLALFWR